MFSLSKISSCLLVFLLKFLKCSLVKKHIFKIIFALGIGENVRVSITFSSARRSKPRNLAYRDGYARAYKDGGPWLDPSLEQSFWGFFGIFTMRCANGPAQLETRLCVRSTICRSERSTPGTRPRMGSGWTFMVLFQSLGLPN